MKITSNPIDNNERPTFAKFPVTATQLPAMIHPKNNCAKLGLLRRYDFELCFPRIYLSAPPLISNNTPPIDHASVDLFRKLIHTYFINTDLESRLIKNRT